jgi:hypothetical protein
MGIKPRVHSVYGKVSNGGKDQIGATGISSRNGRLGLICVMNRVALYERKDRNGSI